MGTGLFFGSFNPVHRGHEEMASSFLATDWIDDLWIVLTPSPPHKENRELAPYQDRWNMLERVFFEDHRVLLSDVEQRMNSPHYTVRTLEYLKNSYPDRSFYLCIGGDTLQTLATWFEYERIARKTELIVAERPGVSREVPPELASFTVHYCSHEKRDVSSTAIREKLSTGILPGTEELNRRVLDYILEKGLYGTS